MRELTVIDWRMVQLFLDDEGVCEVELDINDNRNQRCSCKRFSRFKRCKHVKWIEEQIVEAGGHYSIQIPVEVPEEVANAAFESAEAFRDFVINYAKVEVI